jgi:hypothetical protein
MRLNRMDRPVCVGLGRIMPGRSQIAERFLFAALSILQLSYGSHRVLAAAITNCDSDTMQTAIAGGGTVSFQCDGTIVLTNTVTVTNVLVLDGTGQSVTLSGAGTTRLFHIIRGAHLSLINLTLSDGRSTNGGAIYNEGVLTATSCIISNNQAVGIRGIDGTNGLTTSSQGSPGTPGSDASGGAIYNSGTVSLTNCIIVDNIATGGQGGAGGNGGPGRDNFQFGNCRGFPGGHGVPGGSGGPASGGAMYNLGELRLHGCTIEGNQAIGGAGGRGGDAGKNGCLPAFGGNGVPAAGATGGDARGGAIFTSGLLELVATAGYSNIVMGGSGGTGGATSN